MRYAILAQRILGVQCKPCYLSIALSISLLLSLSPYIYKCFIYLSLPLLSPPALSFSLTHFCNMVMVLCDAGCSSLQEQGRRGPGSVQRPPIIRSGSAPLFSCHISNTISPQYHNLLYDNYSFKFHTTIQSPCPLLPAA